MTNIEYKIGDVLYPDAKGVKVIAHITKDEQKWGAGFVKVLSNRWMLPEKVYRSCEQKLGMVQFVKVNETIIVANMCAQHGFATTLRPRAVNYSALRCCLKMVGLFCQFYNYQLIGPKFGAGLAGGHWSTIENIIKDNICTLNVPVTIYDLRSK